MFDFLLIHESLPLMNLLIHHHWPCIIYHFWHAYILRGPDSHIHHHIFALVTVKGVKYTEDANLQVARTCNAPPFRSLHYKSHFAIQNTSRTKYISILNYYLFSKVSYWLKYSRFCITCQALIRKGEVLGKIKIRTNSWKLCINLIDFATDKVYTSWHGMCSGIPCIR